MSEPDMQKIAAELYSSSVGFCRDDGLPFELHTPQGWLLCGNDPPCACPVATSESKEGFWQNL